MKSASTARSRAIVVAGGVALVLLLAVAVAYGPVGGALERTVGLLQNEVAQRLNGPAAFAGYRLYAIAFVGGLVASISPCILGMLPVNLSYIGASAVGSRGQALLLASAFVAGVVVVNTVLGLASSLFFAVVVEYRAILNVSIGALTLVMGLWMLGVLPLQVPSVVKSMPAGAGPFVVGLAFALIASPCASPILVAMLAAVSVEGSPLRAASAMAVYSIGYTAILFLASLFGGMATASRRLLAHGELISRIGAASLLLVGIGTIWYGVRQF